YGVGAGTRARLIAPSDPRGNRFAAAASKADPVVAEIVGVAFRLRAALMRFDDRVLQAVLVGERDRLVERIEAQLHLVQGILRARPAHQRVGVPAAGRLELQEPFAGLPPARL